MSLVMRTCEWFCGARRTDLVQFLMRSGFCMDFFTWSCFYCSRAVIIALQPVHSVLEPFCSAAVFVVITGFYLTWTLRHFRRCTQQHCMDSALRQKQSSRSATSTSIMRSLILMRSAITVVFLFSFCCCCCSFWWFILVVHFRVGGSFRWFI